VKKKTKIKIESSGIIAVVVIAVVFFVIMKVILRTIGIDWEVDF